MKVKLSNCIVYLNLANRIQKRYKKVIIVLHNLIDTNRNRMMEQAFMIT